ncbi:hypothetical protein FQN60_011461, partial [Etheostoma spectabile]
MVLPVLESPGSTLLLPVLELPVPNNPPQATVAPPDPPQATVAPPDPPQATVAPPDLSQATLTPSDPPQATFAPPAPPQAPKQTTLAPEDPQQQPIISTGKRRTSRDGKQLGTLPKHLTLKEYRCKECDDILTDPILITSKGRILMTTGIVEGISTYSKSCVKCGMFYRHQEWDEGLHNFDDHIILPLHLCLTIRNALQRHTAVSRVVETIEATEGVSFPNKERVLQGYLHFEALTEHDYNFACVEEVRALCEQWGLDSKGSNDGSLYYDKEQIDFTSLQKSMEVLDRTKDPNKHPAFVDNVVLTRADFCSLGLIEDISGTDCIQMALDTQDEDQPCAKRPCSSPSKETEVTVSEGVGLDGDASKNRS